MFNEIVVQEEAQSMLDELGVRTEAFKENYFTADSVETVGTLVAKTTQAGAKIFNLVSVEDVIIRPERVTGLVINWTAVEQAALHVDPLALKAHYVIDATGHAAEVVHVIERKVDAQLLTKSGKFEGERSLWADRAEETTEEIDCTRAEQAFAQHEHRADGHRGRVAEAGDPTLDRHDPSRQQRHHDAQGDQVNGQLFGHEQIDRGQENDEGHDDFESHG